jgi:hypothetical protein
LPPSRRLFQWVRCCPAELRLVAIGWARPATTGIDIVGVLAGFTRTIASADAVIAATTDRWEKVVFDAAIQVSLELARAEARMTTLAKLLKRKQQLTERLEEEPGSHEREEIERLLLEIDEALDLLGEARPGTSERAEQ